MLKKSDIDWFSGMFTALSSVIAHDRPDIFQETINASGLKVEDFKKLKKALGEEWMETNIDFMKKNGILFK